MSEVPAVDAPKDTRPPLLLTFIRTSAPSLSHVALTLLSAVLLVLSFPNFDLWWLAWIGLAPLVIAVANTSRNRSAFVLGLLWGTLFFYGTCWWLTYPMIHYGGVSAWLAYPLLLIPIVFVSIFPALACACTSLVIKRFGIAVILATPLFWVAFDWLRYEITGQVWNAIGYSQAFHPMLIQTARWGGVYAVTLLILISNAAIGLFLIRRRLLIPIVSMAVVVVALIASSGVLGSHSEIRRVINRNNAVTVVGIQPNVPMDVTGDDSQMKVLLERHLALTRTALQELQAKSASADLTRLVIWPESPMNFSYGQNPELRNTLASFARANHASVLLNSLEQSENGSEYNSAILVNEQGEKVARYDKIRLMPFGEYVPLPRWLPGSGSVRGIVGEFTPGNSYTLMPLGALRAGVFICIEAAHPSVARSFTNEGADVLINISNDGYLGPTAVMRQHLSNAIFRAVENGRDLIRVTNSGISAHISSSGAVFDATTGFHEDVRTWTIGKGGGGSTFYTRHGDVFAYGCALIGLGFISVSFVTRRRRQ